MITKPQENKLSQMWAAGKEVEFSVLYIRKVKQSITTQAESQTDGSPVWKLPSGRKGSWVRGRCHSDQVPESEKMSAAFSHDTNSDRKQKAKSPPPPRQEGSCLYPGFGRKVQEPAWLIEKKWGRRRGDEQGKSLKPRHASLRPQREEFVSFSDDLAWVMV